jgi:hypothetical protein
LHGPYVRLDGFDQDGRRHSTYLHTLDEVDYVQGIVARRRSARELCRDVTQFISQGRRGRPRVHRDQEILAYLGYHRCSGEVRERRDFPREVRWRREYELLDPALRPPTVEIYIEIGRRIESEKHRCCRLSKPFDELGAWARELAAVDKENDNGDATPDR